MHPGKLDFEFAIVLLSEEVKKNEMGGACSTNGGE
jgi:hypothetical protein